MNQAVFVIYLGFSVLSAVAARSVCQELTEDEMKNIPKISDLLVQSKLEEPSNPPEMQNKKITNEKLVWFFPKRDLSLIEKTSDKELCNEICSEIKFDPVCGYNGEEHFTFLNYCEFKLTECKTRSWKMAKLLDCIEKYQIQSKVVNEFNLEDLVKEKVESMKIPDAKDETKESIIIEGQLILNDEERKKIIVQ